MRVIVVGLDSAPPELVFGPWLEQLPTLRQLVRAGGVAGPLRSCVPPITVPAWSVMTSGYDPGQLGLYGFRNRADRSYTRLALATALDVLVPRLWDLLSAAGLRTLVISVPQTYPPSPVNGVLISCFLTPTGAAGAYPAGVAAELEHEVGPYVYDVEGFRGDDKPRILADAHTMLHRRFAAARYLAATRPWDFLMLVEIGVDRVQHAFWHYMDPLHPKHVDDPEYRDAILDYYQAVDGELGQLLDAVHGDTAVLVVSDHGARAMHGGLCVNEWLRQAGYLTLRESPTRPGRLEPDQVDWSRTLAWGDGGYYGRIFLNVRGREPEGAVAAADFETVRGELALRLAGIDGPDGRPWQTRVLRPEEVYASVTGVAPDLLVYFDDLAWRAVGSVGLGTIHTLDNDTGPDGANHAEYGILIASPGSIMPARPASGWSLGDIAPTVLGLFGLPIPAHMRRDVRVGEGAVT